MTKKNIAGIATRSKLIEVGMQELEEHGVADFSVRRVTEKCKLSCTAQYRHFKSKEDFINQIYDFIAEDYAEKMQTVYDREKDKSAREVLLVLAREHINYMLSRPNFRELFNRDYTNQVNKEKGDKYFGFLEFTVELIKQLQEEKGLSDEAMTKKMFMVRSILYGAVTCFDIGEMECNDEAMAMVISLIEREMDLD